MLTIQKRLQSSRAHDVAGLRQALAYPESLLREFRGIPENKVSLDESRDHDGVPHQANRAPHDPNSFKLSWISTDTPLLFCNLSLGHRSTSSIVIGRSP